LKMETKNSLKKIASILNEGDNIFIFPHIMMDGDALGSSAALCRVLRSFGKRAWILIEDSVPDYLKFLDEDFCTYDDTLIRDPEICIAIDCSDLERLGKRGGIFANGRTSISIDHHATFEAFAHVNCNDSSFASSAEMVYELILEMNGPATAEVAEGLYTGIITDTGNFQYSNTTAMTLRRASALLDWGLDHQRLIVEIYQSMRPERVKLNGRALWEMELFSEGKGAIVSVTRSMLAETGAVMEETEGISEALRNIKGVEISVLLKEWEPKLTRVSLRAKTVGNVAHIARAFGGGGHVKAAGCTLEKSIEESKELLKAAIEEHIKGLTFQ
jgi:phosphoesterase RecJ-like protein